VLLAFLFKKIPIPNGLREQQKTFKLNT